MTPELLQHLKDSERLMLHPYLCPAGVPTIGYGHVISGLGQQDITEAQAETMLLEDAAKYEAMALRMSPCLKDDPRRLAAITDFCFNLGGSRYAASVLRLQVNKQDWPAAAAQMKLWVNALNPKTGKKEPLAGLVKRRAITAQWLVEG